MNISTWFQTTGQSLLQLEQDYLDQQLNDLFGYQLLQIGGIGDGCFYKNSRAQHCYLLATPELPSAYAPVIAEAAYLPFATDQTDIIILPHSLDFSPEPEQLLKECERLLIPEGYLLIISFNAFIWRWRQWLLYTPEILNACYPLSSQHLHLQYLQNNLGFKLKQQKSYWFYPKKYQTQILQICGIQILIFQKKQSTLIPIKPHWHQPCLKENNAIKSSI